MDRSTRQHPHGLPGQRTAPRPGDGAGGLLHAGGCRCAGRQPLVHHHVAGLLRAPRGGGHLRDHLRVRLLHHAPLVGAWQSARRHPGHRGHRGRVRLRGQAGNPGVPVGGLAGLQDAGGHVHRPGHHPRRRDRHRRPAQARDRHQGRHKPGGRVRPGVRAGDGADRAQAVAGGRRATGGQRAAGQRLRRGRRRAVDRHARRRHGLRRPPQRRWDRRSRHVTA